MRKRKRLLRVAVASALFVVAVPSAAMAYALDDGAGQVGTRTEKAGCSLDPRILKMEPQLCSNQVTSGPAVTFDDAPAPSDNTEIQPASSDRSEIEIGWLMVGIAVAAGGVAGLIVGLRRGPQALS